MLKRRIVELLRSSQAGRSAGWLSDELNAHGVYTSSTDVQAACRNLSRSRKACSRGGLWYRPDAAPPNGTEDRCGDARGVLAAAEEYSPQVLAAWARIRAATDAVRPARQAVGT